MCQYMSSLVTDCRLFLVMTGKALAQAGSLTDEHRFRLSRAEGLKMSSSSM